MGAKFIFDTEDVKNIPGLARQQDGDEPFLTPVFFKPEVLVRYFYDPRYTCKFSSETYGRIGTLGGDWYLAFGINPNGKVIAWLGDIREIPVAEQQFFSIENVPSDHDISSDFFDAQIEIRYDLSHIDEVEILLIKKKLNAAFTDQFGFSLYLDKAEINVLEIQKQCSRYKRIVFNSEDDLKRFVSEWYEVLIEDTNISGLRKYLKANGHVVGEKRRELKTLEQFIISQLGDTENRMAPLYYLGDLRIWADHRDSQRKLLHVTRALGFHDTAPPKELYTALIKRIFGLFVWLQNEVARRTQ